MSKEKNEEYYNNLDKRSKEYKEYKANFKEQNSTGLGDIVEKVTKATGIKAIVEKLTDDCGCEERKQKLNKTRLKRRTPLQCFTEEEFNFLGMIFTRDKAPSAPEVDKLIQIEERIYNKRYSGRPCTNCVGSEARRIYTDLKLIYETYSN